MGDKISVSGYAAAGVYPAVCESRSDARDIFSQLVKNEYKIIFVTESVSEWISDEIDKYRFLPVPAVILIPGASGNTGKGMAELDKSVEKAIGSKII